MKRHIARAFIAPGVFFLSIGSFAGETRYWRGTVGDLASDGANWVDSSDVAGVPETGDDIVLDAASGDRPLVWDLDDVAPGSWTQSGYGGTVTLPTGETGVIANKSPVVVHGVLSDDGKTRQMKILGRLTLQSGTWVGVNNPSFAKADVQLTNGRGAYRVLIEAQEAVIAASAAISVVSNGFTWSQGPGCQGMAGASHGGRGFGYDDTATSSQKSLHCYGDIRSPETIGSAGSGGGAASGKTNGSGLPGGAVRLNVTGALVLDGAICADASEYRLDGRLGNRYMASGGSVWVTAASLTGSGRISANGAGTHRPDTTYYTSTGWGAGGGGRISLQLTSPGADFSGFAGTVTAYGGLGGNDGATAKEQACCGTIYMETPGNRAAGGELILRGRSNVAIAPLCYGAEVWSTMETNEYVFARVSIENGASFAVGAGCTVSTAELKGSSKAVDFVRLDGGRMEVTGPEPIENCTIRAMTDGSLLTGDPLKLGSGAVFVPDFPMTISSVVLSGNATITHTPSAATDLGYRVDLTVGGDFSIDETASINVNGAGYGENAGPGAPQVIRSPSSHGGLATTDSARGGCYGDFKNPTTLGSGSMGEGTNVQPGASGGGAVKLAVGGTLTVNGTISANGGLNKNNYFPAAGGSIWLTATNLTGSGSITANGGTGTSGTSALNSEGAGGGRIALTVLDPNAKVADFAGTVTAYGGAAKYVTIKPYGGAGTIYRRNGDQDADHGTLIIDNGGSDRMVGKTVLSTSVGGETVGNVLLTGGARLLIGNGRTLAVNGDWVSDAAAQSTLGELAQGDDPAGCVAFVGSGVSNISGTNFFADVSCTVPGKTLAFSPVDSYTRVDGVLAVAGGAAGKVRMCSQASGEAWLLEVAGSATVAAADVSDSDASYGKSVIAFDSDGASARNTNWVFMSTIVPGEIITWTGEAGGGWADIGNWDLGRIPVETDDVRIPAGCDSYPALSAAGCFNKLSVAGGASLDLGGFSLTVTNALACAGTLIARGNETVTLRGSASFAGATLLTAPGVLVLAGDGNPSVDFGGLSFSTIRLANTAQSATLSGGFAARRLLCSNDVARTYAFESGKTFVVTDELVLNGAAGGGATLTLASTVPSSTWSLDVRRYASVSGVNVFDSAAVGRELTANAPSSGERCTGWVFGAAEADWTGLGGDNLFDNGDNWSSGVPPDDQTYVRFASSAAFSLGDAQGVSVRSLVVADGAQVSFEGRAALTVADTVEVSGGGRLVLDCPTAIAGYLVVRTGGTVTHSANGAWDGETDPNDLSAFNRLVLTVGHDAFVEAGGAIEADGKGFPGGTYENSVGSGPGRAGVGLGGAAHGGRYLRGLDYGSAIDPVAPGSGGARSLQNGGGVILLSVGGVLSLEGDIRANGYGYPETGVDRYCGAGGSIRIVCGVLTGAGKIAVKGGDSMPSIDYSGSGGRLSVRQTGALDFSGWTGSFIGSGGLKGSNGMPAAPGGTIYLKSAGNTTGRLVIDWRGSTDLSSSAAYTPIFSTNWNPTASREWKNLAVDICNDAKSEVTADLRIGDFTLPAGTSLHLHDHVLTLTSREHRNAETVSGKYSPTWPGTVNATEGGSIRWLEPGMTIILR